jgi:hypothetical protein
MSHPQSRRINKLILRHAWLNLWDKHMTTGRINQVPTVLYIYIYIYDSSSYGHYYYIYLSLSLIHSLYIIPITPLHVCVQRGVIRTHREREERERKRERARVHTHAHTHTHTTHMHPFASLSFLSSFMHPIWWWWWRKCGRGFCLHACVVCVE